MRGQIDSTRNKKLKAKKKRAKQDLEWHERTDKKVKRQDYRERIERI